MSKKPETQEQITDISIYIAILQTSFKPANEDRYTTHWFTTSEVLQAIKEIDPSANISKEQIFNAMTAAGFQCQNRPGATGLDFRWMMQLKDPK